MRYWDYYIALEADLLICKRYVEFDINNLGTYSQEFMHLLFANCSEVEVLLKQLCARLAPSARPKTITECKDIVEPALEISTFHVEDLIRREVFAPFIHWSGAESPSWWKAYNDVKHNRVTEFQKATLENCILALAALFVLNLYQADRALADAQLFPKSRLFKPILQVRKVTYHESVPGYDLPNAQKLAPA